MRTRLCYKTSRDYARLKELLDMGYHVVCFTTYDYGDGYNVTDVCKATLYDGRYQIAARGIEYVSYWPEMYRYKSFEEACEANEIEFIEPTIVNNPLSDLSISQMIITNNHNPL